MSIWAFHRLRAFLANGATLLRRLTHRGHRLILGRMLKLDADNAGEYLRSTGRVADDTPLDITRLTGGVSNEVLYVAFPGHQRADFVLKQARDRLRVPEPWHCSVTRIWREIEVLRVCDTLLRDTSDAATGEQVKTISLRTPQVLFEDRENYCFAMTAAPRDHVVWKQELLQWRIDPAIATACGRMLGQLHGGSWQNPRIAEQLADRQIFDELRLDPYFRFTASQRPQAAGHFERLIVDTLEHRLALVHADFSPKNLLVYQGGLLMVDFETGHFGDPAFDLGFFLSHLLLKAFNAAPQYEPLLRLFTAFWDSYATVMSAKVEPSEYNQLVTRGIQCLAGCAWARLDGKSGIDYLDDSGRRDRVREFCLQLFIERPSRWMDVEPMYLDSLKQC